MGRLRVALFVSEFEDPNTDVLCKGAVKAAREKDYDLYIFPAKFLDVKRSPTLDKYAYQNNCLFDFILENNIDVAIVNTGNIAADLSAEEKRRFLQKIMVPVILISDTLEEYSCVNFNNGRGMVLGIEHLIKQHGIRKFGFVSGPKNNTDAMERYHIFEQSMRENNIPPEQYRIVEGNFSYNCMEVIGKLLDEYPEMDALVCANDMMCYGAYQVLEARHMRIGKDIAVMGFDDLPYSGEIQPGLSTVRADSALLGYEAVCLCEKVVKGEIEDVLVDTTFVARESCGCCKGNDRKTEERDVMSTKAHLDALNHTLVSISRSILDYEEENYRIYSMILNSLCSMNIHSVYLYTFEDSIEYKRGQSWSIPEYVQLRAYYKEPYRRKPDIIYQPMPLYYYPVDAQDIKEIDISKQRIPFGKIFSNVYSRSSEAVIRIVTMVYAGETQYGFLVWEIDEDYFSYIGQLTYQIANALKTNQLLCKKSQMAEALEESLQQIEEKNSILEEISKIDELTQIYNRRGFLDNMKRNVIARENKGRNAIAIYADMNNLKLVNDQFGHEEGDYSLCAIARILHDAVHSIDGKGDVGRIGGDEFCAYLITDEKDIEAKIRQQIDEITENLNCNNDKLYYVSMSVGIKEFTCSEDVDVSFELEQADAQLYIYKQKKRKSILK